MTPPHSSTTPATPKAQIVNVEIVYTVSARTFGKGKVTVTPKGVYECDCTVFALYPGCAHVDTVKTQRKTEGRKF